MGWCFSNILNNLFPNSVLASRFNALWSPLPESVMGRWGRLQNGDLSNCVTFSHIYDLTQNSYCKEEHEFSIHPTHHLFSFWHHCGLMDLNIFWNIIILCYHFLMLKSSQIGPLGFPLSKLLWPFVMTPLVKSFLFIWDNKMFQNNVVVFPSTFGICFFPKELQFSLVENRTLVPKSGRQLCSFPQRYMTHPSPLSYVMSHILYLSESFFLVSFNNFGICTSLGDFACFILCQKIHNDGWSRSWWCYFWIPRYSGDLQISLVQISK